MYLSKRGSDHHSLSLGYRITLEHKDTRSQEDVDFTAFIELDHMKESTYLA